jgi:hypothetical protein
MKQSQLLDIEIGVVYIAKATGTDFCEIIDALIGIVFDEEDAERIKRSYIGDGFGED